MKTQNIINKILIILLSLASLITACKKESETTPMPTTIDYTKYKIKQSINYRNANVDTTSYLYVGENFTTRIHYSSTPSTFYFYNYVKNGSQYDVDFYSNTTHTHSGFYNINTASYIDTGAITNLSSSTFNNRDKNYYNAAGQAIRTITNYNTYENDVKRYYNSGNDFSYWIYDQYNFSNPALTKKDSVVFEYYTDKTLHVQFENAFADKLGKLNNHLVKKRTYYDLLNSNNIRQTQEYSYETDSIGLVTKRISSIYTQPGNVLGRADTTYYFYYNN